MKIVFFNTKDYDRIYFDQENCRNEHDIRFIEAHLNENTVNLITDETAVCVFINDCLNANVLSGLKSKGVKIIALRSAGFNHVDLATAKKLGLIVTRVPAYSPYAVAEHAVALLMTLNRKIHRAHNRVREGNFSLNNLLGFDIHGKTVGVIGTGKIGQIFSKIMLGFGCHVLAHDVETNAECIAAGVNYVSLNDLLSRSDIISLHCPLNDETHHLINEDAINLMKPMVTLINTSRGKLIDTKAVITALKAQRISLLGLDVYEEEEVLFFDDFSSSVIQDDVFARLLTFPNVLVTSHQAFFTQEALTRIAHVTLQNISEFEQNGVIQNGVDIFT
ncbi:MAG: hydroxyacid dehydrogenase [Alteromonadaceae bacterium]|uniref:2-hydroxyacid dehydrogenase n=1 Tax=Paraglaciecola chathamensis TaxID=368405 RepID=UPI000C416E98|nr:2-hydroxyacid dehydrogenase [Paraglaciecola agarilytica]MBN26850.1 hydroxyacid dehydrogenase [Alteromonadaceae bacterium]|tara:strand:- start:25992 stop:26990 length:999 start_codon:yes stop_codon:yes gene_type:complete